MKIINEYTISEIYDGATGAQGTSVVKVVKEYTKSSSPTNLPANPTWSETKPELSAGEYLWERERTDLNNNTSSYGNAHCDVVISGLIFDVDNINDSITQKIWQTDIDSSISDYDGTTASTIRSRVSTVEQTVNGYDVTVSGQTSHVDGLTERMTSAEGRLLVNENAITAMVTLDGQSSAITLTNNMIEAMTNQFIIKGSDNTTTVISGGKIVTNSIKTGDLATDAIKSTNYVAPTQNGTAPYSVSGSFFNLTSGEIITPYFVLKPDSNNASGTAYLNGIIETESGHIGGFVISENAIYHNRRNVTSVDLSDDIYIMNSDPYVLDEEDYLYGGYASLYEVYMGIDGISCGFGKFAVDSSGELFASDATIRGTINATSGQFGTGNGYYNISSDGLVGYHMVVTGYYIKLAEIPFDDEDEYDLDSFTLTTLSVSVSQDTYSLSDIMSMNGVSDVTLKNEDGSLFIIIETDDEISASSLLGGEITDMSCTITYEPTEDDLEYEWENFTFYSPIAYVTSAVSGTELGYDYLQTDKIIASNGITIENISTIGTSKVVMDSNSLRLYSFDETDPYFYISDLRDPDTGYATVQERFVFNGYDSISITIANSPSSIISISFNDSDITGDDTYYTQSGKTFTFTTSSIMSAKRKVIAITYTTTASLKAFTFGSRGDDGRIGNGSTAEGQDITASGLYSHGEGRGGYADGNYSHTEGLMTRALGEAAHAEGDSTYAYDNYTHAEGSLTQAYGECSHVSGLRTISEYPYQTVIGKYNKATVQTRHVNAYTTYIEYSDIGDYAFIIGNGSANSTAQRSNALTVDWDGNVEVSGYYNGIGFFDGAITESNNTRTVSLSLGNYLATGFLSTITVDGTTYNSSYLFFSIPTGRVYPTGTTISSISFDVSAYASSSNGQGLRCIKPVSGSSTVTFNSTTTSTFYDAASNQRTISSSAWNMELFGGTNIRIILDTRINYCFSGNSTNHGYVNYQPIMMNLSNIEVTFELP